MEKDKKMYVLFINKEGFINFDFGEFEECSLSAFADDYDFMKHSAGFEINTTKNGNVYFTRFNSNNYKVDYVLLYVLKTISMKELKEDVKEIKLIIEWQNMDEE